MAKRQNFVVGSTNPNTQTQTVTELNNAWDMFAVLRSGKLDGVFNAVSDYSNDASNEIANAILSITGSEPTGNSQDELAGALAQMRSDIETSSLTFKGYVGTSAPSTSDYVLVEGNIWINSATMPTTFPIAASDIKEWNGSAWVNYGSTYTPADFDFFRNTEDNEGYYWFGGQWTIMSTDMSTTYFALNQNTGKWEIKSSVNLPGSPTTTTPAAGDNSTKIATTEFVTTSSYRPNLFDVKWADHELDDMSWLRADTFSWQDGTVYSNAYLHLAKDIASQMPKRTWADPDNVLFYTSGLTTSVGDNVFSDADLTVSIGTVTSVSAGMMMVGSTTYMSMGGNAGTPQTETIDGVTITYYLGADGHKICDVDQESNISSIYASTGIAWYYILDRNHLQFKLPRINPLKERLLPNSLTVKGTIGQSAVAAYATYVMSDDTAGNITQETKPGSGGYNVTRTLNQTIVGMSVPVSDQILQEADKKILYFYVGQFSQSATAQTAGLNAELFNNKVDLTSSWNAPSSNYVDLAIPAHAGTVQAPADGWICVHGYAGAGAYVWLQNDANGLGQSAPAGANGSEVWCNLPVKKGDSVKVGYYGGTLTYCRFIYAEKSN